MNERVIDFFYDIGSSYSYLASSQVEGIETRSGWTIRSRPFLLGAVFKATGNAPPAGVAAKLRWLIQDTQRWAGLYGIPFNLPSRFPLLTLPTQRALCAASILGGERAVRAMSAALFHAYWADDRDVTAPEVIGEIATGCGLDAAAVLEGAASAPAKELLRAATDEAVAKGAFGAPTFVVGDQVFWGNDRIVLLERHVGTLGREAIVAPGAPDEVK
jgi:2-hydroxychromene-2-carboxylate isomerase